MMTDVVNIAKISLSLEGYQSLIFCDFDQNRLDMQEFIFFMIAHLF